jgi:hypothetical protein
MKKMRHLIQLAVKQQCWYGSGYLSSGRGNLSEATTDGEGNGGQMMHTKQICSTNGHSWIGVGTNND